MDSPHLVYYVHVCRPFQHQVLKEAKGDAEEHESWKALTPRANVRGKQI